MSGYIISCNRGYNLRNIRTWLSLLIRLGNKSRWSHTARTILLHDTLFVIDSDLSAHRNGIGITPWHEWIKDKTEIHIFFPVADYKIRSEYRIDAKALAQCGVARYDVNGFKAQASKAIFGVWDGENDPERASKHFYCSEFVAWLYTLPSWWKLTPEDIYSKRKKLFPNSDDVYEGSGKDIDWIL